MTLDSPAPTFAGAFACIGPACEDMCCRDWAIPLDRQTYAGYKLFPAEKLGNTVALFVDVPDPAAPDAVLARIHPTSSGVCPFFAADRLCDIQREYGPALLSATCSSYPRALNRVGNTLEGSLFLSCPEAVRNILLHPGALQVQSDLHSGQFRTDNFFTLAENAPGVLFKPYRHFALIRGWITDMLEDRSRPLWHRLLLLGAFCQKLSAIATPDQESDVPAIVADYRQILGSTWGGPAMDATPAQPALQLSVLLRLTAEIPQDATCGARFRQTYVEFIEGIAATPQESDLERYTEAAGRFHQPFFERQPWILENFLVNHVHQHLFPFGRGGSARHTPHTIFDEYLLLAIHFFWLNGLLTGVAGCHREAFAESHLVRTVQSFCREVEHVPTVPATVLTFLRDHNLNNLPAIAALLHPPG